MLGLAANEPGLTGEQRRWRRERRSALLRLFAFLVVVLLLQARAQDEGVLIHAPVIVGYGAATLLALALALTRRGPPAMAVAFVVADALLVVALFHEHLFAPDDTFDESLTAPSIALGFVLLAHTALRLRAWLVLLFSALVIGGWMSLLVVTIASDRKIDGRDWSLLWVEVALAASFAFAAFVCYLLVNDHDKLLRSAVASERRHRNLARFFSPRTLGELQAGSASLDLSVRRAVVMFVDLRSFTRLSESIGLEELAGLLAEYRELVTRTVFAHGGTVDKFIGDGVMAVFGQPRTADDDARRAVQCALALAESLARWRDRRARDCKPTVDAGIGLHVGPVIGGVLESGSHDEFTVFGDVVNVAERLERLSKRLDAAVVASENVLVELADPRMEVRWRWQDAAALDGRNGTLRIGYLARADFVRLERSEAGNDPSAGRPRNTSV